MDDVGGNMFSGSKRYRKNAEKINRDKVYAIDEALQVLSSLEKAKFDETVEVAVRLGIDPKKTDQMVRGAVVLPNGLGKPVRVLVFAKGEKVKEALDAGADYAGAEDLVEKIEGGWMEFDKTAATPDVMGIVSKLGRVLGPKGLMPNPKLGTVSFDIAKVVKEQKAGKVEFRSEKAGIVHAPIGKLSFGPDKLKENFETLMDAIVRAKPRTSKGVYIRSASISSTMSPGLKVNVSGYK